MSLWSLKQQKRLADRQQMFASKKTDQRDPNAVTLKHLKHKILAEKHSGSGRQWETYVEMNQNVKYA